MVSKTRVLHIPSRLHYLITNSKPPNFERGEKQNTSHWKAHSKVVGHAEAQTELLDEDLNLAEMDR